MRDWQRSTRRLLVLCLALVWGCSGEVLEPVDAIAPLVGDWEAVQFLLTSVDDPSQSVDLVDDGASFTMNIQPSGQYTAILTLPGDARTSMGILTVDGSELVFNQEFPEVDTSRATFSIADDTFRFQGPTQFSFDSPGVIVDANLDAVLERK